MFRNRLTALTLAVTMSSTTGVLLADWFEGPCFVPKDKPCNECAADYPSATHGTCESTNCIGGHPCDMSIIYRSDNTKWPHSCTTSGRAAWEYKLDAMGNQVWTTCADVNLCANACLGGHCLTQPDTATVFKCAVYDW